MKCFISNLRWVFGMIYILWKNVLLPNAEALFHSMTYEISQDRSTGIKLLNKGDETLHFLFVCFKIFRPRLIRMIAPWCENTVPMQCWCLYLKYLKKEFPPFWPQGKTLGLPQMMLIKCKSVRKIHSELLSIQPHHIPRSTSFSLPDSVVDLFEFWKLISWPRGFISPTF